MRRLLNLSAMAHFSRSRFSGGVVEWFMALVLKTGRPKGLVGSNPTPSASLRLERSAKQKAATPE